LVTYRDDITIVKYVYDLDKMN